MSERKTSPDGITVYLESIKTLLLLPDESAGRVIKAAAEYFLNRTEPREFGLAEQIVYTVIREGIDKGWQRFLESCERNRRNRTGISDESSPVVTSGDQSPTELNGIDLSGTEMKKPPRIRRNKYGEYKRVLLTDDQYSKLLQDMGQEELDRCIRYVDESAQSSGNKNKWSDWNLVIRRCHREGWGRKPEQRTAPDLSWRTQS